MADRDTDGTHEISIHALHEESDVADSAYVWCKSISIHALHEESDSVACVRS